MDTVELVMAVEAEFDIHIANTEAEEIATAGDLCDIVARKLMTKGVEVEQDVIWSKMHWLLKDRTGHPSEKITRESRIIDDLGMD